MTQAELIAKLAEQNEISKSKAEQVFKSLCGIVKDELKSDGSVTLPGVGTFKTTQRNQRKGRNPRTGKELIIPACKAAKFVVSKPFADSLK